MPLISPGVESYLLPYLTGKCHQPGYHLLEVNGIDDHIHLLIELKPTERIADVAKNLKVASSYWINHESGLTERLY